MKMTVILVSSFVIILLVCMSACARKQAKRGNAMEKANPVSQDLQALSESISLPFPPQSVQWQEVTCGDGFLGPQDYTLVVILHYTPEVAAQILGKTTVVCKAGTEVHSSDVIQDWFPSELKAILAKEKTTHKYQEDRREPTLFRKGAFQDGYVAAVPGTGQLWLTLMTH